MALNKYATIRYRVIDRCLRSKSQPYPSMEKLRQACEEELYGSSIGQHISISTIEKDIWALKNESSLGYAPIAYSKADNGYYYTNEQFSLDLPLSDTDIELIRLATNTLVQFKDSQIFSDLEIAVDKIQSRLKVINQIKQQDSAQVIRFEAAPRVSGTEHLSGLLDCLLNNTIVRLTYIPFVDEKERNYCVHPYLLQEHKNRWYLICFDPSSDIFRTLGLDRIRNLVGSDQRFIPSPEFHPEEYYKHSFGIGIYSGKPVELVLSVDLVQGRYFKAQPLHRSQELLEEGADKMIFRLFVIPSPELIMQLMSYGHAIEVLSPVDIREEIKMRHFSAYKTYQ